MDDLILIPVSVFDGAQQTQFLKFQNKPPDGGVGRVGKILFQLLCGEQISTVSRENEEPKADSFSVILPWASALSNVVIVEGVGRAPSSL